MGTKVSIYLFHLVIYNSFVTYPKFTEIAISFLTFLEYIVTVLIFQQGSPPENIRSDAVRRLHEWHFPENIPPTEKGGRCHKRCRVRNRAGACNKVIYKESTVYMQIIIIHVPCPFTDPRSSNHPPWPPFCSLYPPGSTVTDVHGNTISFHFISISFHNSPPQVPSMDHFCHFYTDHPSPNDLVVYYISLPFFSGTTHPLWSVHPSTLYNTL